jgi:site-specific DNA recombinase
MNIVPVRVAIYVRVSTEEQAEHGYSIDAQLDTLRTYCTMYSKVIFKEYVDRGISGKSMINRHELQQMLKDAKDHLFDEVLVWKINRLARKNIDLLQMVDLLDKNNIAFRSFSENFETATPMGKFALQMMGAVGELERNTIVENVKMGLKQRAKMGKHNSKAPLGYEIIVSANGGSRNRETTLKIVPEEATIIQKIFEMFAVGRGFRSIANELNHAGYTTKCNNPFSVCAVKDIIDNPFFVGRLRYNRYENWSERRRKGKNPNPIVSDAVHPAIISHELWDKVQYLRQINNDTPVKRFDGGDYLLTGLIRCPQCGGMMASCRTHSTLKDGTKLVRMYYSCNNFRTKGSAVCSANSIRKQEAEEFVLDRLTAVLSRPSILKAIVKNINSRKANRSIPLQNELDMIVSRIVQIAEKKQKYFVLYEIDEIDKALFTDRLDELNAEVDRLHAKKTEIELDLENGPGQTVSYEHVRALIGRFEELVRSSLFDQRKLLLQLIIQKISLNEKRKIEHIELIFDENTEHHFLMVAPSADNAEGAFPILGEAQGLKQKITIVI